MSKPIPSLNEMYAFLDTQIRTACTHYIPRDWGRIDYLLDQRLRIPELREFLTHMGARGV